MKQKPFGGARRAVVLAIVAVLSVGLVWGLATAFAASASPTPGAGHVTLRIGWTEEPDNLNPFIGYQNETYEIWALNYDLLFGYGDRNQPTLDLASQFPTKANGGISADGLTWTIKIRSGVKWQDGQPLTAADVAFTFNYIVKNQMANFTNSTFGIKSATALDPTTVRSSAPTPRPTSRACGCRSFPSTSGSTSRRAWRRAVTRSSCRWWAADPSQPCSSRRAATSTWCATRTTGAPSRPSPTSTSWSTRTPTPWSPT